MILSSQLSTVLHVSIVLAVRVERLLNVWLPCPFQHGRHRKGYILASSDYLESQLSDFYASGDQLLVGDVLTSVSLLKVTGSEAELIAKDYSLLWHTCTRMLDEKSLIGANVSCAFTSSLRCGLTRVDSE